MVAVVGVLVVELQPRLALTSLQMMMILEQPPHPYELSVKTEMRKVQLVQTAATDLGLQVKVLRFLSD